MSRWATPMSQNVRTMARPSSITCSSTWESPRFLAFSKNSVTSMYSWFGVSSTRP